MASAFAVASLLAEVKDSTRRVSELVGAVRSSSQMDRASLQHFDVTEGIESTLVMLGHELRDGVTVVREYGADVPGIEAYAASSTRSGPTSSTTPSTRWTGGHARIATRADGDDVVVEIADTGHGMPPEVVARAFEAFYTTKDVGKGTGLGLDIARRIVVERHGGTIDIDSRPGATLLRVRIPARQPES